MNSREQGSERREAGRREFVKKAVAGAAFALPALQTVTSAALAQSGRNGQTALMHTITVLIVGNGTVDPPSGTQVPHGGGLILTANAAPGWVPVGSELVSGTVTVVAGPDLLTQITLSNMLTDVVGRVTFAMKTGKEG